MMDKVVALHGGEVPAAAEPRESVIEALDALLEKARSGQVQAIGFAVLEADLLTSWQAVGLVNASHGFVGACYQLANAVSYKAANE